MQKLLRTEGIGSVRADNAVQFIELPSCTDHTVEIIETRIANTSEYTVSERKMCHTNMIYALWQPFRQRMLDGFAFINFSSSLFLSFLHSFPFCSDHCSFSSIMFGASGNNNHRNNAAASIRIYRHRNEAIRMRISTKIYIQREFAEKVMIILMCCCFLFRFSIWLPRCGNMNGQKKENNVDFWCSISQIGLSLCPSPPVCLSFVHTPTHPHFRHTNAHVPVCPCSLCLVKFIICHSI